MSSLTTIPVKEEANPGATATRASHIVQIAMQGPIK